MNRQASISVGIPDMPMDDTQRVIVVAVVRADGSASFVQFGIQATQLAHLTDPDGIARFLLPAFAALRQRDDAVMHPVLAPDGQPVHSRPRLVPG